MFDAKLSESQYCVIEETLAILEVTELLYSCYVT